MTYTHDGERDRAEALLAYGTHMQSSPPIMPGLAGQAFYDDQKSQNIAALLAFFGGSFGLHNFYLGYTGRALIQLCICAFGWLTTIIVLGFLILPIVVIWGFVEFILIIVGAGDYISDSRGVPLT